MEENQIFFTTQYLFNIQSYTRIKESEIHTLKLKISNNFQRYNQYFEEFQRFIKRIPNIKELEISIDVKFQKEKNKPQSRIKEILDFVIDSVIPQYQDTLETIYFTLFEIQEKSEKDEEKTIKKYLQKILQPLKNLKTISFRQSALEVQSSDFYALKQFLLLLKENQINLPNLKLLDFELKQTENQMNLKSFNQKDILSNMTTIAKELSKIKGLEELQLSIQNLGLEKIFFEHLIQSIIQMKNLKKLGLDINGNRINPEFSVKNIKLLQSLSNQLEKLIYIDSQNFKPSNIKEFSQVIRSLENLKQLQIEQISFKQGLCGEFFQFLSFMPILEEIKFDLESISFNCDDYDYFVKQVKQLENLNSISLVLPQEKKLLSENTLINIIDMVTHFKGQLLDLQLEFNSEIQESERNKFIDGICELKQLQYLDLSFPDKQDRDVVIIDARKQKAQNIWNLKQFEFQYYDRFKAQLDLSIILKLRILAKQNNQVLEKLNIFEQFSFASYFQHQIYNEEKEANNFNNLKFLSYSSNVIMPNDIGHLLIQNNFNTLTQLELSHYYGMYSNVLLEKIKNCKLLTYLNINLSNPNNQFLEQLFIQLKFIQKLIIKHVTQFLLDPKVFLDADYLTDFQCYQAQENKKITLMNDRKVYILQNIIYSQIIQPLIIYQPQFSHLDIVIN